ncbi:Organic hydroperoxide resistance protein [Tenacibaculum litopenaei]|uniref:organic hydroperoxide resistance protein n=1 Tax=Tenacibaculum litopenaei TaxID=396016 RepID=UPI003894EAA8
MNILFETAATTTGGRKGHVKSADGVLDFNLKMPIQLGGDGGNYTNPEQLFAAGYSACFDSALQMVAGKEKLPITSKTTAVIGLAMTDVSTYSLTARIDVAITGVSEEVAKTLLEKAHAVCPYSLALKGNVAVELNLV